MGSFRARDAASAPVLVTGATGFVGSHVVDAFVRAGVPLRALVRPTSDVAGLERAGAQLVEGSMTDPAALRRATDGARAVIHLAALTYARGDAEYHAVNAAGTEALVRAVAETGTGPRRFVYLSSLAAAGPALDGRPVQPDDTPRPLTAYGRSKLAGERAVLAGTDLHPISLRAAAVYGPRDRELFRFFQFAGRGVLPMPTGPDRPLQLIHVEDLAEAVLYALEQDATGIVHIADPQAYPWRVVGEMVADAVGRRARVVRIPASLIGLAAAASEGLTGLVGGSTMFNRDKARELLAPGWLCETDAAMEKLGFVARTPLAEGLMQTARWYRNEGWL